jgi:hypothetical protein
MQIDQKLLVIFVVFLLFAAMALVYIGNGGSLNGSVSGNFASEAFSDIPVYPDSQIVTKADLTVPAEMRDLVSPLAKWERLEVAAPLDDVSVWLNQEFSKQGYQKKGYTNGVQIFSKGTVTVALYFAIINSKTNYVIAR